MSAADEYLRELDVLISRVVKYFKVVNPKAFCGVSLPQYLTLDAVSRAEECTMSKLSKSLGVSMSTITGMLDRLVNMGLVDRDRSKGDRRVVRASLTSRGRRVLNKINHYRTVSNLRVMNALGEDDRNDFLRIMKKLSTLIG